MKNKFTRSVSKLVKSIIIAVLIIFTLAAGALGVSIVGVLENTPNINISDIDDSLNQTSVILDSEGNEIEKIQTTEFRELVDYEKIPKDLINAFIAIEDRRFYKHDGVDPIGILSAIKDNILSSSMRGASTIAQQLARNIHPGSKRRLDWKIQEAYLALKLTEGLGREGVLEKYMNAVFLGQNAYGVQAASKTYFSKNVEDLTTAECAALASIVKNPVEYALYKTVLPQNVSESDIVLGDIEINGVNYKVIYNDKSSARQKHALSSMYEEGYITKEQYEEASRQNIAEAIKPGENSTKQVISSYYSDLIAKQVIEKLQTELNYTEAEAKNKYYTGGIKVYSSIDIDMQKQVEDVFENFSSIVLRGAGSSYRPALLDWTSDRSGNIINSKSSVVYYKKDNIIDSNGNLYLPKNEYKLNEDGSLSITSAKFKILGSFIDPSDYYTINEERNLVTHIIENSGEAAAKDDEITKSDSDIILSKAFLDRYEDLYSISDNGSLIFNGKYFNFDIDGIPQPQGSIVVIDHKTGQIKAIVGGRNQEGRMILNRAADVPRQPGSTIKPIAVYTPALDNGYTAATGIEDAPHYENGKLWPKNVDLRYRGWVSLRESVKNSINVNAVKVLKDIGIEKSKTYLEKFGIINKNDPSKDNFVSASENPKVNDEALSPMALGSLTYGVTNLDLTAAYAALANSGEYIEPLSFTKVLNYDGTVLLEDVNEKREVVSPQIAYVMTDIMKDVLTVPYGNIARNSKFDIAGKTGTTQENQDVWFVGYTPYYTIGSWVGFDNQQLKLSQNHGHAVYLWNAVNKAILENYESARFKEPDGIVKAQACSSSGGKPTNACYSYGTVTTEIFAKGTEPTSYCTVHKYVKKS